MHVEVCYTPELIHQFDLKGKIVVVIDVLRATSCMVAGMGSGVKAIKPVASVEECTALGEDGYLMAGERGGEKIAHFDMGNSPFEYMDDKARGQKIATTTTNGTRAISLSSKAYEVIIGAFLNLGAVAQYLKEQEKDIVLFCAGWKGRYNLEDSLFAGAVCNELRNIAVFDHDATTAALYLYQSMADDLEYYINTSNHAARLAKFDIKNDVAFCAKIDEFDIVPRLKDGHLVV